MNEREIPPQEVRSNFFTSVPTLLDTDHIPCDGDKRQIVQVRALDLNLITTESGGTHPTSTHYRENDGVFEKSSAISFNEVDARLSFGDGLNIEAFFKPEDSPIGYTLKFGEDRKISITGDFQKGQLYALYSKSIGGYEFEVPQLCCLKLSFDKERAEDAHGELSETFEDEGKIPFNDEDIRKDFWDQVKPLMLYPQPDPVKWLVEKGEEKVFVQGQEVNTKYNPQTDEITLEFIVDSKPQKLTLPYKTKEISDIKNTIVEEVGGYKKMLLNPDASQVAFNTVGIGLK